jgi:hypothetical protein
LIRNDGGRSGPRSDESQWDSNEAHQRSEVDDARSGAFNHPVRADTPPKQPKDWSVSLSKTTFALVFAGLLDISSTAIGLTFRDAGAALIVGGVIFNACLAGVLLSLGVFRHRVFLYAFIVWLLIGIVSQLPLDSIGLVILVLNGLAVGIVATYLLLVYDYKLFRVR